MCRPLGRHVQAVQAILSEAISSKLKDERAVDAKILELDRVSQVLLFASGLGVRV